MAKPSYFRRIKTPQGNVAIWITPITHTLQDLANAKKYDPDLPAEAIAPAQVANAEYGRASRLVALSDLRMWQLTIQCGNSTVFKKNDLNPISLAKTAQTYLLDTLRINVNHEFLLRKKRVVLNSLVDLIARNYFFCG